MTWPADSPGRLLVAVDGSPTSVQAAQAAVAMASRHEADLLVLHVLDDQRLRELAALVHEDPDEARRRLEANAERILGEIGGLARRARVRVETRVEAGDPPRVIDEVAREVGADIILVGKVGQRGVRTWFLGSVTRRLVESTRIPVLVIPGFGGDAG